MGSVGLVTFIVVLRPVMIAWFGALNMSTRNCSCRLPPSRMLRAMRQVERALEAAAQVVGARLETDAAGERSARIRGR